MPPIGTSSIRRRSFLIEKELMCQSAAVVIRRGKETSTDHSQGKAVKDSFRSRSRGSWWQQSYCHSVITGEAKQSPQSDAIIEWDDHRVSLPHPEGLGEPAGLPSAGRTVRLDLLRHLWRRYQLERKEGIYPDGNETSSWAEALHFVELSPPAINDGVIVLCKTIVSDKLTTIMVPRFDG